MAAPKSPRKGSLQFWPRKRAAKLLPSVNWKTIVSDSKGLKGFICYKVGMASAFVKDNTEHSMTKGKKIVVPVTIVECPTMKILSVRFYKNGKVAKEVFSDNIDKELKKVIKFPKKKFGKSEPDLKDYDDIRAIVYSQVKKTNIKRTPDIIEIGLGGNIEEKLNYLKEKLGKEISVSEIFEMGQVADVHGLTKGKGLSGPVQRFGITLKQHKSEKGRRKPGSLGPWHPARVTFRVPMAGQLGMFSRVVYNNKIMGIGKSEELNLKGFANYGDVKTDYLMLRGSIQGPQKRQILLTYPSRATKKQLKKKFDFLELR